MFSRRHPVLFFILMFTGIIMSSLVVISLAVMISLSLNFAKKIIRDYRN